MKNNAERHLKTGGDPRTLADYVSLRDELNKLAHPARPDVNWQHAERLCLSLFEHNGVELQTAAWYTLVRTQLAGLSGMNEGLAILDALVSRQWGTLWPPQVHARMEILSGLSKRLQQVLRTMTFVWADLSQLYLAEQFLTQLSEVLQRLELKHQSQVEALRVQIHAASVRLENSEPGAQEKAGIVVSANAGRVEVTAREPWVYVVQSDVQEEAEKPPQPRAWKPFLLGMLTMLVAGGASVWGWQTWQKPDVLQQQYAASLAPLPVALSGERLLALQQHIPPADRGIRETQQQLQRLARLPPDWPRRYSLQLIQQAQALWPEEAKPLTMQWRQSLNISPPDPESMSGWHQGMSQLEGLTNRLNALDEKRGKYMTVSELKSDVFAIIQAFNRTIPVEEQLRQLTLENPPSAAKLNQTQASLDTLLTLYSQLSDSQQPE